MRIYVGNLNYRTQEDELRTLFAEHGSVDDVAIVNDRETGQSRGFAFVTMSNDEDAQRAIEAVNGQEFEGRALTVNEARPRNNDRGPGGGGGRQERW